jgi:hypothetical protein
MAAAGPPERHDQSGGDGSRCARNSRAHCPRSQRQRHPPVLGGPLPRSHRCLPGRPHPPSGRWPADQHRQLGGVVLRFPGRHKADAQLPEDSPLRGHAAVVNAQHAASVQRQRFTSPSWQRLPAAGGRRQRLLWASTAVKNHHYADTKYVAELASPGTIITAPETTLRAFADHGRLGRGLPDTRPDDQLAALGDCGINLERIAAELEAEGLSTFSRSYQQLLDHLRRRAAQLADTGSTATRAVPAQTPAR